MSIPAGHRAKSTLTRTKERSGDVPYSHRPEVPGNRLSHMIPQRNLPPGDCAPMHPASALQSAAGNKEFGADRFTGPAIGNGEAQKLTDPEPHITAQHEYEEPAGVARILEIAFQPVIIVRAKGSCAHAQKIGDSMKVNRGAGEHGPACG